MKIFAGLLVTLRLCAADFEAGMAKVDITPSSFGPMYGYANRKCGPSNGTHDPLFARALVLAAGGSRLAIVTLDLGSIVSSGLGSEVSGKLGIPVLLLAASHTHSGPAFLPSRANAPGVTPASFEASPYQIELEKKVSCSCGTTDVPGRCSIISSASLMGQSIPSSRCCALKT